MSSFNRRGAAVVCALLCLLVTLPASCHSQEARAQVLDAAARLEKVLSTLKLQPDEAAQRANEIRDARSALQAGYVYLSLYKLQPTWVEVSAQEYLGAKADVQKKGLEAFDEEWQALGRRIDGREKLLPPLSSGGTTASAAAQALAETSRIQVRPYYQSGRLYGINTTVGNGHYYIGRAPAFLDFALFCHGLRFGGARKPPLKLRPLDPELSGIENELLDAYGRPEAAERQPQYIRVNVILKVAGELNEAGMPAGALQKYLDARLHLSLINHPPFDAKEVPRLKTLSDALKTRLDDRGADHTIGLIYWEMARSALDRADTAVAGNAAVAGDAEELRRAAVILDKVLPTYFKYVTENKR